MTGRRLYVTSDWSRLVPEGSPEAAFFIREEDARKRGLLKRVEAPADKAIHRPPQDKGLHISPRAQRARR